MEEIDYLELFLRPVVVVFIFAALLFLNSWIFRKIKSVKTSVKVFKNSIALLLVLLAFLIFILSLPIERTIKGQIVSFLAIIISAGIALSSTTVLGNLIAGIMNNSMDRFKNGDLISIGEMLGRVTKKSIFHTEIQLEDSNFITIPNLFIATNPVKLTRKANTVISTNISLGYDVPRGKIEACLIRAALNTGLTDPYVYIMELGDFAVTYQIHGFLKDSGKFFSTTSQLNGQVMDALHEEGIEIVSPTFMNQRAVDKKAFIPEVQAGKTIEEERITPEELIFDKAIQSAEIEKKKEHLEDIVNKKNNLKERLKEAKEVKDVKEEEKLTISIERLEEIKKRIEQNIVEQTEEK